MRLSSRSLLDFYETNRMQRRSSRTYINYEIIIIFMVGLTGDKQNAEMLSRTYVNHEVVISFIAGLLCDP